MRRFALAAGLLLLSAAVIFVVERLNARQLGYWFSHAGSGEFVASGILNKSRRGREPRTGFSGEVAK